MPRVVHTFTRGEITAALEAADLDIPSSAFYARRVDGVPTETCLAFELGIGPADLLAFTLVVAGLLAEDWRIHFAASSRAAGVAGGIVTWPGYALDELPDDVEVVGQATVETALDGVL